METKKLGYKNLMNLLFNPIILSEEEVKEELINEGIDIKAINEKFELLLRRIEAKEKLKNGVKKKEEIDKMINEINYEIENESVSYYKLAARKSNENDEDDFSKDKVILDRIKKREEDI